MIIDSIYFGCDHAGFPQKETIIQHLKKLAYRVIDFGTNSLDSVNYPDYAFKVGQAVANKPKSIGILVCGTGYGMCIAANKVKGVNAVNVLREDMAAVAVEHNDANVLCLSARFVDANTNLKIIDKFIQANFLGGRHCNRVDQIKDYKG
jgi:ribose 5-phosphate isomerase B